MPLPLALLWALLLLAAATGCDTVDEFLATPTSPPPAPTIAPTAAPEPTEGTAPAATHAASGIVLRVSVAPVPRDLPDYDRGEWRHWTDEDGDCQNARQEALIAESTIAVTFKSDERCQVAAGSWQGPYTGEIVTSPGDLDIDHMVPLGNAHRSGAWAWDRDRKREFANFLGYENHLIATTSSANRAKGAKGPEEWRPPLESYWCSYAVDWATIKRDWGLTVTEAEYAALSEMLATCPTPVLLQPSQGAAPALPTPTARPTPPPGMRYDPFGPDRDCSDFDTYEGALAFYIAAGGPGDDPHKLDVNGDGEPCESLPGGPSSRASPQQQDTTTTLYATFGTSQASATPPPSPAPTPTPTPTPAPTATPAPTPQPTPTPSPTPTATTTPTPAPTPTPTPTPQPTTTPEEAFEDRDCDDFADWQQAQSFYLSQGGPGADPHRLDGDGDGVACQSLPGAPGDSTPTPTPSPSPTPEPTLEEPAYSGLPYDPNGPDRNCGDFGSWWDAQNFYLAAGGPAEDRHRLDHNGDGTACESLPGAPKDDPEPGNSDPQPSPSPSPASDEDEFVDRNCSDFDTWQQAQDFYEAEGGPAEDPHHLDHNGDGIVCESLPGAPKDDPEPGDSDPQPSPSPSPTPGEDEFVDRNCSDFDTWQQAQDFYEAEGGPAEDPHHLDHNADGIACESLPGAPRDDPEPGDSDPHPSPSPSPTPGEDEFVDRNCGDFDTWQEAQDFYEAEGRACRRPTPPRPQQRRNRLRVPARRTQGRPGAWRFGPAAHPLTIANLR